MFIERRRASSLKLTVFILGLSLQSLTYVMIISSFTNPSALGLTRFDLEKCHFWRRVRDSNPRALTRKLISSQPCYDQFDTSPCMLHPVGYEQRFSWNGKTIDGIAGKIKFKYGSQGVTSVRGVNRRIPLADNGPEIQRIRDRGLAATGSGFCFPRGTDGP